MTYVDKTSKNASSEDAFTFAPCTSCAKKNITSVDTVFSVSILFCAYKVIMLCPDLITVMIIMAVISVINTLVSDKQTVDLLPHL